MTWNVDSFCSVKIEVPAALASSWIRYKTIAGRIHIGLSNIDKWIVQCPTAAYGACITIPFEVVLSTCDLAAPPHIRQYSDQ